jgi:hypothetical protein
MVTSFHILSNSLFTDNTAMLWAILGGRQYLDGVASNDRNMDEMGGG